MTLAGLTPDDLVTMSDAAGLADVPQDVMRLLVDAHAVSTYRPRVGLGLGTRTLVQRSDIVEAEPEVAASLSNARALHQYLTECRPVHFRKLARESDAPLWVRGPGDVAAVAVRVDGIPAWTLNHGTLRIECTAAGLRALTESWDHRRLVTLPAAEGETKRSRQVSFPSRLVPPWLTERVLALYGPTAGAFDA